MNQLAHHLDHVLPLAGEWHARLSDPGADRGLRAEFERWLGHDDLHRLAYAEICAAAYAVEQLDVETALPHALPSVQVVPLRRARSRIWLMAMAASVLLSASLWQGARPWHQLASDAYSPEGELRELTLVDGSRVTLGADSAISYDLDAASRHVRVLRGEAFFDVAADPARPFVVEADGVEARALGTRYAVAREADGVVAVRVEEGRVAVLDRTRRESRLTAGQQVRILPDDGAAAVQPLATGALEWRRGVLVFEQASMSELVRRLDAYVPGRLVLLGQHEGIVVSAAISSADARASLHAIAAREGLQVDEVHGVLTVLR